MTKVGMLVMLVPLALVATVTAAAASPVPELDPNSASMGVALLAGGLLLLTGRRPRH